MLRKQIREGGHYIAKVSDKLTVVKLDAAKSKGWWALNEATGRLVTIRSAAKLRREATPQEVTEARSKRS